MGLLEGSQSMRVHWVKSVGLSFFKMGVSQVALAGTSYIRQAWTYTHNRYPPASASWVCTDAFQRTFPQVGVGVSAYNPNIQEAELKGPQVQGQCRLHVEFQASQGQRVRQTCLEINKQASYFLPVNSCPRSVLLTIQVPICPAPSVAKI